MEERGEGVRNLTPAEGQLEISDAGPLERAGLEPILEESFEGWYLRHSTRTLKEIELVRKASIGGRPAGLSMLKMIDEGVGYVYYIAVAREFRRMKVGSRLLDDALDRFRSGGVKEVYAAAEEDNVESIGLFASKGFVRTGYGRVAEKHGRIPALLMYRKMMVVPGEILMCLEIA